MTSTEMELADALEEVERLNAEVARLKLILADRSFAMRFYRMNDDDHDDNDELDLELLAKLASGEGGRRTGALRRAGLVEWRVTEAGRAALGHQPSHVGNFECICGADPCPVLDRDVKPANVTP